jgi:hypothetical protein
VAEKSKVVIIIDTHCSTNNVNGLREVPSGAQILNRTKNGQLSVGEYSAVDQSIVDIAGMYRWYFQQESVLWVKSPTFAQFV